MGWGSGWVFCSSKPTSKPTAHDRPNHLTVPDMFALMQVQCKEGEVHISRDGACDQWFGLGMRAVVTSPTSPTSHVPNPRNPKAPKSQTPEPPSPNSSRARTHTHTSPTPFSAISLSLSPANPSSGETSRGLRAPRGRSGGGWCRQGGGSRLWCCVQPPRAR